MARIPQEPAANDSSQFASQQTRSASTTRKPARRAQLIDHLTNPMVVAENVTLLTDQANDIFQAFKPRNGWQDWLTSEVATILIRINRCSRIERKLRDWASYRAIDFWAEDQALEVAILAGKLDRDPAKVVAKLRQTPAGLDWLLARWRFLATIDPQQWTVEQRDLANRLVGDGVGTGSAPGEAAAQVLDLEARREQVEEADAILRGLVEADLSDDSVAGLARLRRYARSLHRQLKWYIDQFHVEHSDRWDDPRRQPAFVAHDLITAELTRKPKWSFKPADPHAATPGMPPSASEVQELEPQWTEIKPIDPPITPEFPETKPSVRVARVARFGDAAPEPSEARPVDLSATPAPVRPDARLRRADPVVEATRRAKANRRRQALACAAGS